MSFIAVHYKKRLTKFKYIRSSVLDIFDVMQLNDLCSMATLLSLLLLCYTILYKYPAIYCPLYTLDITYCCMCEF